MRAGLKTTLLATIPFMLLVVADRIVVTTTVYGDLTTERQVTVEGNSTYRSDLQRWVTKMTPGFATDHVRGTGDTVEIARSTVRSDAEAPEEIEARALDIVQRPFSLVTEYSWREAVDVDYVNEREALVQPLEEFEYRVRMPGRITSASPAAQIDGNTARWTLTRDGAPYDIQVHARAWRWDLIILLVYVIGFLAYRVIAFLAHRARLRPRKI